MAARKGGGKWHYRFHAAGEGGAEIGLAATERNRNAALLREAEVRKAVIEGKGDQLRLEVWPFSD